MPKLRPRLDVLLAAALIAALATQAAPAFAQDYPNRPITLIVPFPPGGSATIIARAIADRLGDALGQQIVIDNRGGAGGSIGARQETVYVRLAALETPANTFRFNCSEIEPMGADALASKY
jgi:tripartite-type tricarboxylate transporter receptor subunit TctC